MQSALNTPREQFRPFVSRELLKANLRSPRKSIFSTHRATFALCEKNMHRIFRVYVWGTNLRLWYIYLNSWAFYIYVSGVYICIHISLSSVCTERWCSELLLLDAEPLPPARVHCIIQFWSLAIKKRNKGRTIALARRPTWIAPGTYDIFLTRNFSCVHVRGYGIGACVFAAIYTHASIVRDFLRMMRLRF